MGRMRRGATGNTNYVHPTGNIPITFAEFLRTAKEVCKAHTIALVVAPQATFERPLLDSAMQGRSSFLHSQRPFGLWRL